MPSSFFTFQQGSDSRSIPPPDAHSLRYGRFRAFSPASKNSNSNLFSVFSGEFGESSYQAGYGSINITTGAEGDETAGDDEPDDRWWLDRLLISPRRKMVKSMVGLWWRRWAILILLPAVISILWCMIPFPTTPIPDDPAPPVMHRHDVTVSGSSILSHLGDAFKQVFDFGLLWDIIVQWCRSLRDSVPAWLPAVPGEDPPPAAPGTGNPGHGASKVAINFWFFLGIYYGFYNLIGLLFIQKVFNMYSLNWYPSRMSFATSFSLANLLPLGVGSILYYFLPGPIIANNLTWIFLTFATMCTPLLVALLVLLFQRKHNQLGGFRGLTETQLLFTTPSPSRGRYFSGRARRRWQRDPGCFRLARSYRRFLWLCSALLLSLIGYVLGEAYAELYLQTLPHSSLETIVYVYSWVLTIYTLDGTTGWILGAKVHSYPLQFVFKLYFSLTYQTYVRALYARLRSPSQFAYLQLLSSSIVIVWNPICMTPTYHSLLVWLRINGQPYEDWKKNVGRAFFLRGLAESISMIAFLGWCIVLHFGWNTKIYPYFSFKDSNDEYTFELTFWASLATWGCEMAAGWVVRRVMRLAFGFRVTQEAVRDFGVYPELLPACLAVSVHVLQNMLFSIIRLRFY